MSRSFGHWSPDYLWSRLQDKVHQMLHPDEPWLTPVAVEILDEYLKTEMLGLEFGSGRSTKWFSQRLGKLTSVEHSAEWFDIVTDKLRIGGNINVAYLLRNGSPDTAYVDVIDSMHDNALDFVLVDGIDRAACAVRSLDKLKPGGVLVVDDVHRYLPSRSRAPLARKPEDGPIDDVWQDFMARTMDWEYIWTSNGVKDTVLYYKPKGLEVDDDNER
jgi:SAM-dependent methyltransferase